ncbi:UDP-Glycosyltransferase/glycogen phosphorylase [Marasmius fiardii PR-910]|nr:UDP-Glycosyltransferase/glycogen phosphorylase [Marasmius fiardii PR-910]
MQRHVLLYAKDHWGHNKPLIVLAVRMAEAREDLFVTILTTNLMYRKNIKELSKVYHQESIISRIRIIDMAGNRQDPISSVPEFAVAFESLLRSEALTCLSSHKKYGVVPPPCVAVIDSFAGYAVDAIKKRIPVFMWRTSPAGSILRHNGPAELGGRTESDLPLDAYADTPSERPATVVPIPGAPPMYDYEWFPQVVANSPAVQNLWKEAKQMIEITDGVLHVSTSAFEPGAIAAAEDWYKSIGKTWYAVGPLSLPPSKEQTGVVTREAEFLDRMKDLFGEKSVIYIAFGSASWLPLPDKLWIVIDELIIHHVPFILAHSSKLSHVPEEQKAKISGSGIGLELDWVDQDTVLVHPATGWFISHGGWNSLQESFVHRVPCILWPFGTDQPYNAAMITLSHQAGFELLSVRREGGGIPFRCNGKQNEKMFTDEAVREEIRGLLPQLKGHEGQGVRSGAERLGRAILDSWNEGQESSRNLEHFLKQYVDQT